LHQQKGIGIVHVVHREIQVAIGPPSILLVGAAFPKLVVRRQVAMIVIRVHHPRQMELSGIAHALDGLGLQLGSTEGGQEQSRQNRDDGDDDQELD